MDEVESVAGAGCYNEPRPRWGHVCVSLQGKVYMWGGRTEDFSESQQRKVCVILCCKGVGGRVGIVTPYFIMHVLVH